MNNMIINSINDKALDNYFNFYSDDEFALVKAFKDKGYSNNVLCDIKKIELLIDCFSKQKEIFSNN